MKTDTAFVRANGVVMLNTVTHIGLYVALVVYPCHAERDYAVWNAKALDKVGAVEFRVTVVLFLNSAEDLTNSLDIFRLVWEALLKALYSF